VKVLKLIIYIPLVFFVFEAYPQSSLGDALDEILRIKQSNTDSSIVLINRLKSNTAFRDPLDQIKIRTVEAAIYDDRGALNKSKEIIKLNISSPLIDSITLANNLNNLGLIFNKMGFYDSAALMIHKALAIRRSVNLPLEIAQSLNNLGLISNNQNDFPNAEKFFKEALRVKLDLNAEKRSIAIAYLNLALAIGNQNRNDEEMKLYDKALDLFSSIDDFQGISMVLNNQAWNWQNVYKNYDSAIDVYNRALEIRFHLKDNMGISQTLNNIALLQIEKKAFGQAESSLNESIEFATKSQSKRELYNANLHMAELLELKKDYLKANQYYKTASAFKDSMLNEKSIDITKKLQTQYETSEKEKQIVEQNLELQKQEATIANQKNRNIQLVGGIIMLILGGLLLYNRIKTTQKQKLQQAILAEKENGFESVINATEQERNRISKDLHDGIGQQLSALKMALNHTIKELPDVAEKQKLSKIATSFSNSADEVRQISHQMMPRALMDDGLVQAIEDLLKSAFQFSDINFEFEHHQVNKRFDEKIEISLYRITQELINNIIKHSKAKKVSVQLLNVKENLILFVEDDGIGMTENMNTKSHGLVNIKSRLDMVKGSINYEPSANSGTSVSIKIPHSIK